MNTKITNVPGRLHNVTVDEHGNPQPLTGANEIMDDSQGKDQETINSEVAGALGTIDTRIANGVNTEKSRAQSVEATKADKNDTYTKNETYTKDEVNNIASAFTSQKYVTVEATAQTTAATDVLPATGATDTLYRVSKWDSSQYDPSVYSEYAWNGSQYIHLSTKTQIGEVFDISAYHATGGTLAKYADLTAALDGGNNIPQSLRKGGMSIKFVQSSDNKYMQYRLMSDTFNTTPANWQGVDAVPTAGSDNLVKSGGVYQFSQTENNISDFGIFKNVGYIFKTNGHIANNDAYRYTDFIPVVVGQKFSYIGRAEDNTAPCIYYDSAKNLVGSSESTGMNVENKIITIPTGVAFIRFVCNITLLHYIDYGQDDFIDKYIQEQIQPTIKKKIVNNLYGYYVDKYIRSNFLTVAGSSGTISCLTKIASGASSLHYVGSCGNLAVGIFWFDENKIFLGQEYKPSVYENKNESVSVPTGAAYFVAQSLTSQLFVGTEEEYTQFENAQSLLGNAVSISEIESIGWNNILSNGYLNPSGDFIERSTWRTTRLIKCSNDTKVGINAFIDGNGRGCVWFDENLNKLKIETTRVSNSNATWDAPNGARFVRLSYDTNTSTHFNVSIIDKTEEFNSLNNIIKNVSDDVYGARVSPVCNVPVHLFNGYIRVSLQSSQNALSWITDFIPVKPSDTLRYVGWSGVSAVSLMFFGINKEFVSLYTMDSVAHHNFTYLVPDGAYYVIAQSIYSEKESEFYIGLDSLYSFFNNRANNVKTWEDKNILVLGDSITNWAFYTNQMTKRLGCNIYNRGLAGTTVCDCMGEESKPFVKRVDYEENNSMTQRDGGMPNASLIDAVIIFGGTNDWWLSQEEIFTDDVYDAIDKTQFAGAYRYIVETLKHKYLGKPIILCTLPPSLYEVNSNAAAAYINSDTSITTKIKHGKPKSFISDVIKEIGALYGCYVIDLGNVGFSPFTSEQANYYYNNGDGVHPNENHGGVVLGNYISEKLLNEIYPFNFV